jgi:hypothetical protein
VFSISRDYYEEMARAYPHYTLKHIQKTALAAKHSDASHQGRHAARRASRLMGAARGTSGGNGAALLGISPGSTLWSNDVPVIRPTQHRKSSSGTEQLDLAALAIAAQRASPNNGATGPAFAMTNNLRPSLTHHNTSAGGTSGIMASPSTLPAITASPFIAAVRRLGGPIPLAVIPVGLEAAPTGLAVPEGSPIIFYHRLVATTIRIRHDY